MAPNTRPLHDLDLAIAEVDLRSRRLIVSKQLLRVEALAFRLGGAEGPAIVLVRVSTPAAAQAFVQRSYAMWYDTRRPLCRISGRARRESSSISTLPWAARHAAAHTRMSSFQRELVERPTASLRNGSLLTVYGSCAATGRISAAWGCLKRGEPPRASGPIKRSFFGEEKHAFPERTESKPKSGQGFRNRGGVDLAPCQKKKNFLKKIS